MYVYVASLHERDITARRASHVIYSLSRRRRRHDVEFRASAVKSRRLGARLIRIHSSSRGWGIRASIYMGVIRVSPVSCSIAFHIHLSRSRIYYSPLAFFFFLSLRHLLLLLSLRQIPCVLYRERETTRTYIIYIRGVRKKRSRHFIEFNFENVGSFRCR